MEFNATFIVSIISFILFVIIMNKIFYAPMSNIVSDREKCIKNNYDEAQDLNDKAAKITKEREERLTGADRQSRQIIASKIEELNQNTKEETLKATKQYNEQVNSQKDALRHDKEEAENLLQKEITNLADDITLKILGFKSKTKEETK